MYILVKVIQYVGILVVISGILYLYPKKTSKQKDLMNIILNGILINQIGYALELDCVTRETAILAIKVAYVGKMVGLPAMFLFVMRYCGVSISKWIRYVLVGLHGFILTLVWTCDKHTLYYKSIGYTQDGIFPHVVLEHGVFYQVFTFLTMLYMILILGVCVYKLTKVETVIQRNRILCMAATPVLSVSGLLIFQTGITAGYDATAISYLLCTLILLVSLMKYDLIDQKEIAKEYILDEFVEAVFVLNHSGKIIYKNSQFTKLFSDMGQNDSVIEKLIYYSKNNLEYKYCTQYYKIIEKSIWDDKVLASRIYVLHDITEERTRIDRMNNYNRNLKHDVDVKSKHVEEMQNKLVLGMADMVENRDPNTGGHIKRTSQVIEILVNEMKKDTHLQLEERFCECMIKAAPMHDLGKIAVDDEILRKPGKFTPSEFEVMKTHAEKGAKIVRQLLDGIEDEYLAQIAENIAHYHHERYDGSGYPKHLKGEEIPLEARIMAIADVYDALVSKRCYKESMSFEDAFNMIEQGMGTQFDATMEPYFKACRRQLEEYYKNAS